MASSCRHHVRCATEVLGRDWTSAIILLLYLFSLSLASLVPLRSHIAFPSRTWPTMASAQSYNSKLEGNHITNEKPEQLRSEPGLTFRPQTAAAGHFTNDCCWQNAGTYCTGVTRLPCARTWAARTPQKKKKKPFLKPGKRNTCYLPSTSDSSIGSRSPFSQQVLSITQQVRAHAFTPSCARHPLPQTQV